MRRIIIIAIALVMVAGIGTAFGANDLQTGSKGISVGMGDSIFSNNVAPHGVVINNVVNISGRYFIAKDVAVTAGFGFQTDGSDADASFFSISGGIRKYLSTSDFAPFVSGKFTYAKAKDNNINADISVFDLEALFGAEYFFSKEFSMEGGVGVGFGQLSDHSFDDTYFGTRTVGVRANFYF